MAYILRWKDDGVCVTPTRCARAEDVLPKAVRLGVFPAGMGSRAGETFIRKHAEVINEETGEVEREGQ